MREAMPEAAKLVDELRLAFGREWVDAALRQGIALQRRAEQLQAQQGRASAQAWLARQRPAGAALRLREGDLQVGELPLRNARGRA